MLGDATPVAIVKPDDDNKSPLDLFYNAWFSSKTDCSELDKKYEKALIKFPIIFSSSQVSVYKICHHFYDKYNMNKSNIKTIDGLAIESYLDPYANHKYNIIQMKELKKDGVLKDIPGKWVVIPKMTEQWSPKLVYLLYNELKSSEALGLIFYSEGVNNFGKVLVENTILDVLQFPEIKYTRRNNLQDDNY